MEKGKVIDIKSKEDLRKNLMMKAYEVKFDLSGTDYIPLDNIGIGAYGVVCSAIHGKTKDRVAIKKIPYIFDDKRIATRTYREIKILKHFKHDNIISIRDILKPKEPQERFRDVYVVFDLMESDLHKIIYSKQELSEEHVRYFLYQLLRGLKYIHSANVIHRDLKPSNLLVNEDCQLRIGDFGMARGVNMSPEEQNPFMTQYVATRWYRAPEIMFALIEYGTAVDMWSVGCIFAEMLGRKHLFPGKDYINQLKLIIGVLGSPTQDLLDLCQSDLIKKFIKQLGNKEPIHWSTMYPKASRKAVDLLNKMLILDPRKRMSVADALNHPYLNKYHDPDDEPICVPTFNFDFEKQKMTPETLRERIYKEIMDYHKLRAPSLSFSVCLKPVPKDPSDKKLEGKQDVSTPGLSKEFKDIQLFPGAEIKGDFLKPDIKPVTVDTKSLEMSTSDVEMLSAKTNVKKDTVVAGEQEAKKAEQTSKEETKTISSDTKALIKAALMNSNFRKRSDSSSEVDDKPKPVTAAQRQKEREEKRRKKKEKANERMKKKEKKEQKPDQLLTDEDRELLQRWAKMQKSNPPIAPKPEQHSQPSNSTATNIILQGSVIPQSSLSVDASNQPFMNQAQTNPFLMNPSSTATSQTSNPSGKSLINVDTMHLLQQKLQARNSGPKEQSNVTQNNPNQDFPKEATTFATINTEGMKLLGMTAGSSECPENTRQSSTQLLGSNDITLHGKDSSKNFQEYQVPSLSSQNSPQRDYSNNSSPESYQSNGSPDPYLKQSHSPDPYSNQSHGSPDPYNQQSPDPYNQQSHNSPDPYNQQSHNSPDPYHQQSHGSPESFNQNSNDGTETKNCRKTSYPDLTPSSVQPSAQIGLQQQINQFDGGSMNQFQQTNTQPQTFTSQFQNQNAFTNVMLQNQHLGLFSTPQRFENSSEINFTRNIQSVEQSQDLQQFASQPIYQNRQNQSTSQNRSGPPNIQVPYQDMRSQDLISVLAEQFSSTQVGDNYPPILPLTPRGTGAGYGVGMDLDSLMEDASSMPQPQHSPLSSSLLTDWMEVTGALNIDMDALEQELSLQSPMALSYNDLSLYPS